jgi:AraC-like DNA-binding protein
MDSDPALKVWREQVGHRFIALDFQLRSTEPFRATISSVFDHDGVRVIRQCFPPGVSFRDKEMVRLHTHHSYALVFSQQAPLDVGLNQRALNLRAGESTLLNGFQAASVGATTSFSPTVVQVATRLLSPAAEQLDEKLLRLIPRRNEALCLLRAYVRLLERKTVARLGPGCAEAVSRHIVDLTALVLREVGVDREHPQLDSLHAVRLQLALAFLDEHCHEPDLSVGDVARHLNISTRSLELLFEASGKTYSTRLLELRLRKAHDLLGEPPSSDHRIVDIALSAGFSDLSYFNRRFRQHFGHTPSALRISRRVQ